MQPALKEVAVAIIAGVRLFLMLEALQQANDAITKFARRLT